MSQETAPNCLPGFGYPLNRKPNRRDRDYVGELFPSALSLHYVREEGAAFPFLTLREMSMLQFMNMITDKPDWHIKVHDDLIVEKWKAEVYATGQDLFTEKMFKYCIKELRHHASSVPEAPKLPPPIIVYDANVVKSDYAVPPQIKKDLQRAMHKFERQGSSLNDHDHNHNHNHNLNQDWHPFSDGKVLDLVHPSLFPLVYGTTRVLEHGTTTMGDFVRRCGEGKVADVPPELEATEATRANYFSADHDHDHHSNAFSRKFQWLPCEVDISGEKAKITSYINNLHPRECVLYALIEEIIDASIPLWDLTLAPLQSGKVRLPEPRITYKGCEFEPEEDLEEEEEEEGTEEPEQFDDEDDDEYWERRREWMNLKYTDTRKVVLPEPQRFYPRHVPDLDIRKRYGKRGIQVIVKLANIVLTPEKPTYNGGSWHVEGQLNENIVATSLYYYSSDNITACTLGFRQQVSTELMEEIPHEHDYHGWLKDVFGCINDGVGVQNIGSVDTREGRLLTFPNILQHRVSKFELADSTKPGHRKILALFLVDPNIKIISTAHVPCQRKDWWMEETVAGLVQQQQQQGQRQCGGSGAGESHGSGQGETGFGNLPVELQMHIFDQVDGFPLGMDEAMALRLELMEERSEYAVLQNDSFESHTFSLCEH